MEDVKIITATLMGDKRGYGVLFAKYNRRVFNFIHKKIYDFHYAEDLTMVTFEKAFEKLDTYKSTHKFSTWLIQIAKYTVIDFIKALQIRVHGTDEIDKFAFIKALTNTPYQVLIENELKALIEGKIDRLPKKSKPVMQLHVIGYSDEEIAEKLSMIHGNVRCIIHRAKKKLEPLKRLLYEKDYSFADCLIA